MVETLHTQYESMKPNLWLICGYRYQKALRMWLLSLVTIFKGLVQIFKLKIDSMCI